MPSGSVLPPTPVVWDGAISQEGRDQLSLGQREAEPAFLGPENGWVASMTLLFHHTWFLWSLKWHRPQMSTQIPTTAGQWTQIWLLAASWVRMTSWLQVKVLVVGPIMATLILGSYISMWTLLTHPTVPPEGVIFVPKRGKWKITHNNAK